MGDETILKCRIRLFGAIHRALACARRDGDHPDLPKPSVYSRLAAAIRGKLWRAMRRVVPRKMRAKVEDWLLRQIVPMRARRDVYGDRPKTIESEELGINIVGYVCGEFGLGEAARGSARAAAHAGISVALIDFREGCAARMSEDPPAAASSKPKHRVNLFHINAPAMLTHPYLVGYCCATHSYNIGYWLWETTDLPDSWTRAFDFLDEIWTSSTFCLDVISRKSPVPVIKVPVCVEPVSPAPMSREDLRLPSKGLLFLSMADFFSAPERKNPIGTLDAFRRAFGSTSEEVYLVLKLSNSEHRPEIQQLVRQRAAADSRIILIEGYMDRPVLNALISSCDCLVSLHRSEGFGLPIAEAMYFGKPAIATGWSSNMDFMTVDNSLPVRYRVIPINEDQGPYSDSKGFWADPDLDHAAHQMRKLAADPSLAPELGRAAQMMIREHFSAEAIGDLIRNRLMFIREHLRN